MKKICLIASSGGHFEQISMLKNLDEQFEIFFVTERTKYSASQKNVYYLKQVNRKDSFFLLEMITILLQSLKIFLKEKPDIIISTGALSVIPMFFLGKIFKKKLIFIESFAKINSGTMTGKFLYKLVDYFIIQWPSLQKVYPKAVYLGSIY